MPTDIFNFYAVALIDILGQSDELEKYTLIPKGNVDEEFLKVARATVGRVRRFRKNVLKFHMSTTRPVQIPFEIRRKAPPEAQNLFKKYMTPEIDIRFFSDLAVVAINLKENPRHSPLISIFSLFFQLSLLMLTQMAAGVLLRGGLDIGICTHITEKELYGQALSRAHNLEAKIADYPRIVLGTTFMQYLQSYLDAEVSPPEKIVQESYLHYINQCIEIDKDGQPIFSYLCPFIKNAYSDSEEAFNHVIKASCGFISGELVRSTKTEDKTVASRMAKLKNYFQTHNCWIDEA